MCVPAYNISIGLKLIYITCLLTSLIYRSEFSIWGKALTDNVGQPRFPASDQPDLCKSVLEHFIFTLFMWNFFARFFHTSKVFSNPVGFISHLLEKVPSPGQDIYTRDAHEIHFWGIAC